MQVSRDGRHPGDANWGTSGRRDRSETGISPSGNARGAQAVEGLNLCSPPGADKTSTIWLWNDC